MKTILIAIIILIASIATAGVSVSYEVGPVNSYLSFYGDSDDYRYTYVYLWTKYAYIEFSQEWWEGNITNEYEIMAEKSWEF